jgi:hypothetical protein
MQGLNGASFTPQSELQDIGLTEGRLVALKPELESYIFQCEVTSIVCVDSDIDTLRAFVLNILAYKEPDTGVYLRHFVCVNLDIPLPCILCLLRCEHSLDQYFISPH